MSTLEVGPVFQTSRLANLQTSFTSLLSYSKQSVFCIVLMTGSRGLPGVLALGLFFSETLEQEAYNDTARRLLWYVQCPGYEDTMEPH